MAQNILEILSFKTYSEEYRRIESGIPDLLPEGFLTNTKPCRGDSTRILVRDGQRKVMTRVAYGSPARGVDKMNTSRVDRKLIHFYESIPFDPLLKMQLRDGIGVGSLGDAAVNETRYQIAEFKQRQVNTRIACAKTMLSLTSDGTINFDSDGDLQPSASGAALTITSSQVPANNRNQLNSIIGTSWATDSADILGDIAAIKQQAAQLTGKQLKYAFYGINVPEYMASNTVLLNFMARTAPYAAEVLARGEVPRELLGLTWIPMHLAFFEDADGTNQTFFGADHVTFTPDPADFWTMHEGSYAVPTTTGIAGDPGSPGDGWSEQTGMFSFFYRSFERGVLQEEFYAGDTFLPDMHANMGAACPVFLADVTP